MKFSVVVHGNPISSQANYHALKFCQAVIDQGHKLQRVFFYGDAVTTGIPIVAPQNELDIPAEWRAMKNKHDVELIICIAAALKRGVLDDSEQQRYELPSVTMSEEFELSGLGQLIDATQQSDRLITFK